MTYCSGTGKVSYDSKGAARTARRKINERLKNSRSRRKRFEREAYLCRFCKKWHLASTADVR